LVEPRRRRKVAIVVDWKRKEKEEKNKFFKMGGRLG
jgi:hypothetical protein